MVRGNGLMGFGVAKSPNLDFCILCNHGINFWNKIPTLEKRSNGNI